MTKLPPITRAFLVAVAKASTRASDPALVNQVNVLTELGIDGNATPDEIEAFDAALDQAEDI